MQFIESLPVRFNRRLVAQDGVDRRQRLHRDLRRGRFGKRSRLRLPAKRNFIPISGIMIRLRKVVRGRRRRRRRRVFRYLTIPAGHFRRQFLIIDLGQNF